MLVPVILWDSEATAVLLAILWVFSAQDGMFPLLCTGTGSLTVMCGTRVCLRVYWGIFPLFLLWGWAFIPFKEGKHIWGMEPRRVQRWRHSRGCAVYRMSWAWLCLHWLWWWLHVLCTVYKFRKSRRLLCYTIYHVQYKLSNSVMLKVEEGGLP